MAQETRFGIASREELPECEALFALCFGAPEEGHLVLSQERFRILRARRGEQLASMLTVMPLEIRTGEAVLPAAYLYGVATHPAFRGEGLCSSLLEYAHRTLAAEGAALSLLLPSSEKNRRFYGARGYLGCSRLCSGRFTAAGEETLPIAPVSAPEYAALRDRFCPPESMHWGREELCFQEEWLRLYGGGFWRLGTAERPLGCLTANAEENGLLVRELLTAPENITPALNAFCKRQNLSALTYRLAEAEGVRQGLAPAPFAMAFPLGPEGTLPPALYVNLVFD